MPENAFSELVEIMAHLRQKCPWDRQQTHGSLRRYILEEAYEVVEAIDELVQNSSISGSTSSEFADDADQRERDEDASNLKEELGDLLLQIVFQAEISEDVGEFNINDVIKTINEKLIRRHPHIFSNVKVSSPDEVTQNWEQIKKNEKNGRSHLDGVPKQLPALLKAYRVQSKAAHVGAEMRNGENIFDRLRKEISELENAYNSKDETQCSNAFGRILFSLVALGRFRRLSLEDALRERIAKFDKLFRAIEKKLEAEGKEISDTPSEDIERLWR